MIVIGGESLVDLVPADPGTLAVRLGGGPYNAAIAAARLGAPTALLSRVSTDPFGEALVDRLRASGVSTALLQRGAEPTTLAVVAVDAGGHARYSFYTEGTADRLFTDPGPLPETTTALAVGSLGLLLEPGASGYEAVLRRSADRGVLTALDPNIRPAMISDPAAYRARFGSWLPHVRLLKLSVDDALWLAAGTGVQDTRTGVQDTRTGVQDTRTGVQDTARGFLAAGAGAVVLTDGPDGCTVYTASVDGLRIPAAPATVVDTIGAGDTVFGALLAWLHAQGTPDPATLTPDRWADAVGFAARAAAVTVSRSGAEPPTAAELHQK